MKTAIYIENGRTQIVLTPESEWEKTVIETIGKGQITSTLFTGSFSDCQGGWVRQFGNKDSLMILLEESIKH